MAGPTAECRSCSGKKAHHDIVSFNRACCDDLRVAANLPCAHADADQTALLEDGAAGPNVMAGVVCGRSVFCVRLKPPVADTAEGQATPLLGGAAELVCETQVGASISCWDFSRNSSKGVVQVRCRLPVRNARLSMVSPAPSSHNSWHSSPAGRPWLQTADGSTHFVDYLTGETFEISG